MTLDEFNYFYDAISNIKLLIVNNNVLYLKITLYDNNILGLSGLDLDLGNPVST